MVEREARDKMALVLRSYMNREIGAFDFDEALSEIEAQTHDVSVRAIRKVLWCYYDDISDHFITATRPLWQFFNRILLFLESEAELPLQYQRAWMWPDSPWLLLVVGVFLFSCLGWDVVDFQYTQCIFSIPFCILLLVVLWGICRKYIGMPGLFGASQKEKQKRLSEEEETRLIPFESFGQLREFRRSNPTFLKLAYPGIRR